MRVTSPSDRSSELVDHPVSLRGSRQNPPTCLRGVEFCLIQGSAGFKECAAHVCLPLALFQCVKNVTFKKNVMC